MKLFQHLEQFQDNTALIGDNGDSITYRQLIDAANRFSRGLGSQRCVVAVNCRNDIDTVIAYVGLLQAGHVALLLDATLEDDLKSALLHHYQVNWLYSSNESEATRLVQLNHSPPPLAESLSLLLSTSGSTGSPKLVKLSEKNLHSNAASIAKYLALDATERPITVLPFHYSYGLSVLNSHLLVGATVLVTNHPVTQREFWNFFKQEAATSLAGVPYTYEMLHRLRFNTMALPSLRYCTQAGGKLRSALVSYFSQSASDQGQEFIVMYGQTEATARISYLPSDLVPTASGSIGRAIPGGSLWLQDEDGRHIKNSNEVGELIYAGDNVMMGYASSIADLALDDQCQGKLETGDLAYFDEDGLFYITGRKKRFIKLFGNRVDLDRVESFLVEQGISCATIGGDEKLYVICTNSQPEKVKSLLQKKFHFHPSVVEVKTVDSLQYSSAGKVQYSALESQFLSED